MALRVMYGPLGCCWQRQPLALFRLKAGVFIGDMLLTGALSIPCIQGPHLKHLEANFSVILLAIFVLVLPSHAAFSRTLPCSCKLHKHQFLVQSSNVNNEVWHGALAGPKILTKVSEACVGQTNTWHATWQHLAGERRVLPALSKHVVALGCS